MLWADAYELVKACLWVLALIVISLTYLRAATKVFFSTKCQVEKEHYKMIFTGKDWPKASGVGDDGI